MSDQNGYVHRPGIHSESACQRNILAAGGHDVDEHVIFGLDGGFGFSYFPTRGNTPDIIVGKQVVMPLRAARLLGVEVHAHTPKSAAGLAALLEVVPAVTTRVDIGLMPYWGLEGRASFGGYFVNVVRATGEGEFEVSDPAFDSSELVRAEDLNAARSSRSSPPLNPDWRTYTFGSPRNTPRLDLVGPVAVRTLSREVLRPGSRSLGIPAMKVLTTTAPSWPANKRGEVEDVDLQGHVITTSALARQLLHLGRQIESFGTGGGMFRPVIARFLSAVSEHCDNPRYAEAADLFGQSAEHWTGLGKALLARSACAEESELKGLVDEVVTSVRVSMDLEKRALAGLTSV
ncbi:DUF4872 domain-containing protein [Streptomyces sp. NPDC006475]|uniref:DUF4872 domain-containing protein n=1 Tax=Streptomyces achmelvichensis TaxID=3134111 RepID=A0ACC6Q0I6_9ACTN|nr:BtrH N-terminal domain-containing protein [Streptomyces sp. NBC_01167]